MRPRRVSVTASRLPRGPGAGWATFALIVSLAWLVPWYIVWLLPLAALSTNVRLRQAALWLTVFLVLFVSIRAVGVPGSDVSFVEIFAGWALIRIITTIPVTPGGLGQRSGIVECPNRGFAGALRDFNAGAGLTLTEHEFWRAISGGAGSKRRPPVKRAVR